MTDWFREGYKLGLFRKTALSIYVSIYSEIMILVEVIDCKGENA